MKTSVRKQFARVVLTSGTAFLTAVLAGGVWGQDSQSQSGAEAAREKKNEKLDAARDKIQGARESAQEARKDARGTVREDRQSIREARREARTARREFIAERLRSGDFGLFFRRLADRLQVSDIANR